MQRDSHVSILQYTEQKSTLKTNIFSVHFHFLKLYSDVTVMDTEYNEKVFSKKKRYILWIL